MINRNRRVSRVLALLAGFALMTGIGAPARAAAEPELPSFPTALLYSFGNPDATPPGANDWSCTPSRAHPRPVVLVHGTWENRYDNFAKLSPALKRAGYCVFALNYGARGPGLIGQSPAVKGYGDIGESAKALAAFVDRVRASTESDEVDLVGHSQGGMMARQYLKFEGGTGKVHTLVSLGATHHGTTLSGIATLAETLHLLGFSPLLLGDAAQQQVVGSSFLAKLNEGGDTVPGVDYLAIATKYDEVTTPYSSAFLTAGPGATVRNVTLQDGCPLDLSDHLSMTYSARAIGLVERGLDPSAPPAPCGVNLPVL
ncbi:esterase/lipase family protein [Amycolatopsis sp. CA-230715]|uniref:esterase/lipase family protein n=1 Tax=Amycolatopsis sp. CA-230715 TaxID=2745196 RepID=UPI001C025982|nr:alpha/beta fold hydrolase [Amycolatopsis sp. CA-230715]QWF77275.1 hypothetical protein HUW46_00665 [Amycolatopsis sp. CA-230715]